MEYSHRRRQLLKKTMKQRNLRLDPRIRMDRSRPGDRLSRHPIHPPPTNQSTGNRGPASPFTSQESVEFVAVTRAPNGRPSPSYTAKACRWPKPGLRQALLPTTALPIFFRNAPRSGHNTASGPLPNFAATLGRLLQKVWV